jgi:hypothetical protein
LLHGVAHLSTRNASARASCHKPWRHDKIAPRRMISGKRDKRVSGINR